MVGFSSPPESLNTDDRGLVALVSRLDDPVEVLVNSLLMVVLEVFGQDMSELLFGGQDEMLETFLLDGPAKSFRVGIEIGTSRWQFHRVYTSSFYNALELGRVKWISFMNQVLFA